MLGMSAAKQTIVGVDLRSVAAAWLLASLLMIVGGAIVVAYETRAIVAVPRWHLGATQDISDRNEPIVAVANSAVPDGVLELED
jgi:hypothetical protein